MAIPLPNLSFGFGSSYGPGGSNSGGNVSFGNVAGYAGDLPNSFWDKASPTIPSGGFSKIAMYGFAALAVVLVARAFAHKGK